jgi:uncharacterized protein YgiM (DUF1202 family)
MNQEPAALPNPAMMSVRVAGMNLRSAPSRTARVVGTVAKGSQVKVIGRSGKWVEIETEARSGWVSANLLSPRAQARK